ncbi:cyclopropane-fatty-acyl-phospholipid synthase family protein [Allohahella marinimesophila]|uniref:Cyclopropane-fatty-acyl-phospholipid synthase family protein n=1 Tax=Allohahella marinimesophila TaxID=1054972 RepID=A0ABP7PEG9_9GAMM
MIDSIVTTQAAVPSSLARYFFFKLLERVSFGELRVVERLADGEEQLTVVGASTDQSTEAVTLTILDDRCYGMIMLGGVNGAAEAFMSGFWTTDDLVALMQLMLRNRTAMDSMDSLFSKFSRKSAEIWHAMRKNTLSGSRKNISAHYDLGNDFFRLFLDERLMYSSAFFAQPALSHAEASAKLSEASTAKLDKICRALDLKPNDHLVEIGTGWGSMAVYAAKHFGCRVTTTTISNEQFLAAKALVAEAGLEDRVVVLCEDYRDLTGSYNKLVSVEMVEAVGHQFIDGYFACIEKLLKPGGTAVLQAITIEDWRYEAAVHSVDFIKRYIFPGSFIPCPSVLINSAAAAGLRLQRFDDFGLSYAATIQAWTYRFRNALDDVRSQGFDERFIRMWFFYLAYCEGGFRERSISVAHLTWEKPAS